MLNPAFEATVGLWTDGERLGEPLGGMGELNERATECELLVRNAPPIMPG